jgi:hypothetical protein
VNKKIPFKILLGFLKKPNNIFSILLIFKLITVYPQETKIYNGYIAEESSGERIIGATIVNKSGEGSTISNDQGLFTLFGKQDSIEIQISYVGYKSLDTILIHTPRHLHKIQLTKDLFDLGEVEILGHMHLANRNSTVISQRIKPKHIKQLPSLLGEKDPMKILAYLPGVSAGDEGFASFHVRGGSVDQNLVLLDGTPVYNSSHLLGLFSVFIPETIKEVEMIKGGFPAKYGGRLSSICDIRMKEGNRQTFHGDVSIGTLSSKIVLEGPIKKDKASFIIGARRTYLDILMQPFIAKDYLDEDNSKNSINLFFYDISGKVNWKINDKHQLFLSIYNGKDKFQVERDFSFDNENSTYEQSLYWGNLNWIFRLHSRFGEKLFSRIFIYNSNFNHNVKSSYTYVNKNISDFENFAELGFQTNVNDFAIKWQLDHKINEKLEINYGIEGIQHNFTPGQRSFESLTSKSHKRVLSGESFTAPEVSIFYEAKYIFYKKVILNAGIRNMNYMPPGKRFSFVEPRVSINFEINKTTRMLIGASLMNQPIHLLTSSGIGFPIDIWVPSTRNLAPQNGTQLDMGIYKSFNMLGPTKLSINAYYKEMHNIQSFQEGISYIQSDINFTELLTKGKGTSYGAEILIEKSGKKYNGWISYTLAKHDRKFKELNNGKIFPFKYDRRHEINLFANYSITSSIDIGASWNMASGAFHTFPTGMYQGNTNIMGNNFYDYFLGETVPFSNFLEHYTALNNVRLPTYHRLDINFSFRKKKKTTTRTWSINIYNVYGRKNPYYFYWHVKNGKRQLKQFTLFRFVPGISYNLEF